jgi:hypothetical protein
MEESDPAMLYNCRVSPTKLDLPLGRWYKGRVSQVWNTAIEPKTRLIYIWNGAQQANIQYKYNRPIQVTAFPANEENQLPTQLCPSVWQITE